MAAPIARRLASGAARRVRAIEKTRRIKQLAREPAKRDELARFLYQ
jgi:hypothetical protein